MSQSSDSVGSSKHAVDLEIPKNKFYFKKMFVFVY